jgi:hypothetical protein
MSVSLYHNNSHHTPTIQEALDVVLSDPRLTPDEKNLAETLSCRLW